MKNVPALYELLTQKMAPVGSFESEADLTAFPVNTSGGHQIPRGSLAVIMTGPNTTPSYWYFDRGSAAPLSSIVIAANPTSAGRWRFVDLFPVIPPTLQTTAQRLRIGATALGGGGGFTELGRIPAGFVPATDAVLIRALANVLRTDAGGVGIISFRVRNGAAGPVIFTFSTNPVTQNQVAVGGVERTFGVSAGVAMNEIVLEWDANVAMTVQIVAPDLTSLVLQDINEA